MAERRMFAKTIIDSDAFLDMPLSAQALYFHLSMRADDEGFVNNPKKIKRVVGASDDDIKILAAKNFIIPFDTGVVVIKHWRIHNYIRADRLTSTKYQDERQMLSIKENGAYTMDETISECDELDAEDKRKSAYRNSTLPYSFTYKIRRAFDSHPCPVCGCTMNAASPLLKPTIQHNVPISKGGEHELGNISVVCLSCNTSIRDEETGALNNAEVVEMWDKIVAAESQNIEWFWDVSKLDEINVGQVTDKCQADVSIGKDSIGKDRLGKDSIRESKPARHKYGQYLNVLLSDDELETWKAECPQWMAYINDLSGYMTSSGKSYKNHLATLRNWYRRDKEQGKAREQKQASYDLEKETKKAIDAVPVYERRKK